MPEDFSNNKMPDPLFGIIVFLNTPESEITKGGAMQAFTALRAQAKNNGVADMSLDDINKEIGLAYPCHKLNV